MKKLFPTLFFVFLFSTVFAQRNKEGIGKTFAAYFLTLEQKENVKALEYIYPKLFNLYPKEEILKAMDNMKEDTEKDISVSNPDLIKISKIIEVEGVEYALMEYSFIMTITVTGQEQSYNLEHAYGMFQEQYGEKNVVFEKENNRIKINAFKEMYAINDLSFDGWKFLEKLGTQDMPEQLIPEQAAKKL